MSTPTREIRKAKKKLYELVKAGSQLEGGTRRVKKEINQFLRVDDQFKNSGDVVIIQNAQINSKVVRIGTEALEIMDRLQDQVGVCGGLESALKEYFLRGYTWAEMKGLVKDMYFETAVKSEGNATSASIALGVGRTTVSEHKNKRTRERRKERNQVIEIEGTETENVELP